MKKKVRKPRSTHDMRVSGYSKLIGFNFNNQNADHSFNLYYAKRLYKFLGQAIAWLEQKERG